MRKVILSIAFVAALASCQQSNTEWSTRKVLQDKPVLTTVNINDTSIIDHGDGVAFEALLRDTTGKVVGDAYGWLVAVAFTDSLVQAASNNRVGKIGSMIVNLDGDDIVVAGKTSYDKGQSIMKNNYTQKRAILGGTGKYRGITGEVLTTRNEDNTYTHEMIYKIPD
jgi:hypothetical protein